MMIEILDEVDLPGIADLDDDGGYAVEYQDDTETATAEVLEFLAGLDPATATRRDYNRLKHLLREIPAVAMILEDYHDDDQAVVALSAALRDILPDGAIPGAGNVSAPRRWPACGHGATQGHLRPCQWKGCSQPAKERAGLRGPHPKFCEPHTRETKLRADRERLKARGDLTGLRECCRDWVQSGNRGMSCPQCREFEDERRKPLYPGDQDEAAWLARHGFHFDTPDDPKGWRSDWGPEEGNTVRGIRYTNLTQDEVREWFRANKGWQREPRKDSGNECRADYAQTPASRPAFSHLT